MLLPRLENDQLAELELNELQKAMKEQVSEKVTKGVYPFEEIACPVCESQEKEVIGEKDRYGLFFKTNICTDCGLMYTSPRMTQKAYNEFYNIEYRKLYGGENTATDTFFARQKKNGRRLYRFLQQNKLIGNEPLFVFEVGCGAGGIIDVFREEGHDVKGIDLGEEYIEYGKKVHGLDLEVGILSNYQFQKKPDIIIYSHVLEHILDLDGELEAIKNSIHEHTLVYLEVPGVKEIHKNYESNILKYFQNAHTFHFTLETLTNLMAKKGFQLLHGNQFVQSVFQFTNQKEKLASDYEKSKRYILNTERLRKLHSFRISAIKQSLKKRFPIFRRLKLNK